MTTVEQSELTTDAIPPVAVNPAGQSLTPVPLDADVLKRLRGASSDKLSYKVKSVDRGIIYPELDPFFDVTEEHSTLLQVINEMSKTAPQNVMVVGPQGCGKTELAVWYAAKYNLPLIIMNCAVIREAKDWFGYRGAREGSVYWHKADFVRALEMGECVVVMDEFNRLHTTLHNSLYPLLDARRSSYIEELEGLVAVAKGTVFFSTCNIGFTHTGTFTLDSAMEDRWGMRIDVNFPDSAREKTILINKTGIDPKIAEKLTVLGSNLRTKSQGHNASVSRAVSTRQLLATATLMKSMIAAGIDAKKALDYTIIPFYSKDGGKDSEQAQVLQVIQGLFA